MMGRGKEGFTMMVSDRQLIAALRTSQRRMSAPGSVGKVDALRGGRQAPTSSLAGDDLALSSRAREVMTLRRALSEMPPNRTDRLAGIRERVARGTYHVPLEDVAEKIITRGVVNRIAGEGDR